ncbi:hypothetical protein HPB52_020415 [Rhipicephalus sanguineus]|uniref:Uncharacterized protein n=1 Tax=Rhipicephalus sanguineus TaxID=34632 RepID=A0A9D4SQ66_RHISA|nr:hypothetical protein HPB52_020415 [Rhipicephalus sanguineus]
MRTLGLELEESMPGALLLQWSFDAQMGLDQVTTAREASLLASSLLRQHRCIQDLSMIDPYSNGLHRGTPAISKPHLDTVTGLETLHIDVDEIDENFAAQIDAIMERNRSTLKKVHVSDRRRRHSRLRMMESLVACEYIVLKSCISDSGIPDVDSMAKLMGVSTTLKEVSVQPIRQVDVSVIAKALEMSRTLTELSLHVRLCESIEELFGALELNKSLKELSLWGFERVNMRFMRAVASAMENNTTLMSLNIDARLDQCEGMQLWSQALSKNCTLHVLILSCWSVPIAEVSVLCKALRVNKTLKALRLLGVDATNEERTSLARQLLADECYDRVVLGAWTEPCLRILSPVLASPKKSAQMILLPPIGELSLDIVKVLFNDLASNRRVKRLSVCVEHDPDTRVALVCEALKKNRFIQLLHLTVSNGNSANEILRALSLNTGIRQLEMCLEVPPADETMAALSGMLLHNKGITSISALLYHEEGRKFLDSLAQGMSGNRLILDFRCCSSDGINVPCTVLDSVRRNKAALNRAVEFVLRHREDRRGAECFELFVGRSCLMTHLTEVSGLSYVQARHEVGAAEHRLREKYFVLTGIVGRSVSCWPADSTQIDALNADCWRSLASYLRISDVPGDYDSVAKGMPPPLR